jgi:Txe/YoeB family toxin of Txe-Axe toxin-antitoxin module
MGRRRAFMTNQNSRDTVKQILELIEEQTRLLQKQVPMTEEEAQAYQGRFSRIKTLVEQLRHGAEVGESVQK